MMVLLCSLVDRRLAPKLGYSLFVLGGLGSIINFYLSFLRYPIHRLRHGKDAKYQWVSGMPLFDALLVLGLLLLPKNLWLCGLAFLLLCVNTGGILWFVIFTWKDDSLWNPKKYDMDKNGNEE